mgnify:FL=1
MMDNNLLLIFPIAVVIFLILNFNTKKEETAAPAEHFEESEPVKPVQNIVSQVMDQVMQKPVPVANDEPVQRDELSGFYEDNLKGEGKEYSIKSNSLQPAHLAGYDEGYTLGVNQNDGEFKELNNVPNDQKLISDDLLPKDSKDWFETPTVGIAIEEANLLANPEFLIGVNTVGSTRKNANLDIRGNIPNPKITVSPWNNSSYDPDNNMEGLCA